MHSGYGCRERVRNGQSRQGGTEHKDSMDRACRGPVALPTHTAATAPQFPSNLDVSRHVRVALVAAAALCDLGICKSWSTIGGGIDRRVEKAWHDPIFLQKNCSDVFNIRAEAVQSCL